MKDNKKFWARLAANARANGLPACIVFSLPKTIDIMHARPSWGQICAADEIATALLPAWRRLKELQK